MKKLSVLFLIAILGIVLWALPAGAAKIRLTDAELDGITAGAPVCPFIVCVPPPASVNGIAQAFVGAMGMLMPIGGTFEVGGSTPLARGNSANVGGSGHLSSPTGFFGVVITAYGHTAITCLLGSCP